MARTSAANLAEPTTTVASDLVISCPVAHMNSAESPELTSHRVFKTTELLENTFSFLPTNKIFTIQQVSKPWKAAIATSPSIQKKLFVRPTNQEPETWLLYKIGRGTECRRINTCLIPFLYDNNPSVITPLVLNPLVRSSSDSKADKARLYFNAQTSTAALNDRHISLWDKLISDPPCQRAELCARIWVAPEEATAINMKKEFPWEATLNATSGTGLTLGDLVNAVINTRGMAWRKLCRNNVQQSKCHYEWTNIQDLTSKCNLYCHGPCDVENVCLGFKVSPDMAWDDKPFPWSKRGIPSKKVGAMVNEKYVAGGEPVEFLRRDLVDVWRPLVAGLQSQLRK